MAFRTWAKLLGAALGVAALAGASQLGVAYGLGILRLTRVLDAPARDQWTAQLAWVAWFAMTAAVIGGLFGQRLVERWRTPGTTVTWIGLSAAAGLGAALVVPLTMQPARTAQIAGVSPVFVIGICAGIGALVGALAAYAALTQLVARWSLGLVGLIVWVIALISVSPSLGPADPLPAVRLGVFDAGFLSPAMTQRTALFTMPAVALIVGAALGWTARRREMPTLTIALAGLPGPALLTLAYLIAGPGSGGERYQVVPYWAAMTATGAGVLGSVLAAVVNRRSDREDAETELPDENPEPADEKPEPLQERTAEQPRLPEQRAADAFSRTGEWALRRKETPPPSTTGEWAPRREETPPPSTTGERAPRREEAPPPSNTGIALGEYADDEPTPYDAFRTATPPQSPPPMSTRPGPQPYVPAPALLPMPPEAIQQPPATEPPPSRGGGLRGRMPFGRRNRADAEPPAGRPLVPEPEAISPPLPNPEPISPPRVTPPAPVQGDPLPDEDSRRGRQRQKDDEFVDWVNGLGGRE